MKRAAPSRKRRTRRTSAPKYTVSTDRALESFEVIHAAHRASIAEVIAANVAENLRSVAQVVGLANDTRSPESRMPERVRHAIASADTALIEQIEQLERFTERAEPGPIAVSTALYAAAKLVRPLCGPNVKLTVEVSTHLPPAAGNASDMSEAVFALLHNACHSLESPRGGQIRVSTVATDTELKIVVEDSGPGYTSAAAKRLFDPFVVRRGRGSQLGVGLAVARGLARRNGGELVYEARTTRGARFILSFPRWVTGRAIRNGARH